MAESAVQFLERRRSSGQSIGSLQPELYRRRGSVIIQESAPGRASVGRIQLQLGYDFVKSDLLVSLLEVSGIPDLEEYYFVFTMEGGVRRESSKLTAGSKFHPERFKFPISHDDALDQTLTVQLMGSTKIVSGPTIIGCATIELSSIDPSDDVLLWTSIDAYAACENLGEILIGLQYLPAAERLTVTVHQARDLKYDSIPDGCVRVHLIQGGKVRKKKKSAVRKGSDCPVWDEALLFNVPAKALPTSQVEVTVLDYDRIGNHSIIGKVTIGGNDKLMQDAIDGRTTTPRWMKLKPP